jgi:hypothetical protein
LGDNDLVVDHPATGSAFDVGDIRAAYAGGSWTGFGVTSTLADADSRCLGFARSTDLFSTFPAVFSGVSVDSSAILVRLTHYGDANLDGNVNLQDFNRLASNFGAAAGAVWSEGDFNYDGAINLADFNRLAINFGQSAAGPEVTPQDWANLAAVVPEPGGIGLLLAGGTLLVRRRR